jgi:hypothetical protein
VSPPRDWPAGLPAPGAPGWIRAACGYCFDACPGEYRQYELLRRHPAVLAAFAVSHVGAQLEAAGRLVATARTGLAGQLSPEVLDAAVSVAEAELLRLRGLARAVAAIAAALGGRTP